MARNLFERLSESDWRPRFPPWARAQAQWGRLEAANLAALAAVVLPAALGEARRAAIAEGFLRHAEAGVRRCYRRQLQALGSDFAALAPSARRARLQAALESASATAIPVCPNGRHVATDLIAVFFRDSREGAPDAATALRNPAPPPEP
ncbi:MAG: hypothetical protein ACRD2D_01010 [Terriglobales bacterium]